MEGRRSREKRTTLLLAWKRGRTGSPLTELRKMMDVELGGKIKISVRDKLRWLFVMSSYSWLCKCEGLCWRCTVRAGGTHMACKGTGLIVPRNKYVLTGHLVISASHFQRRDDTWPVSSQWHGRHSGRVTDKLCVRNRSRKQSGQQKPKTNQCIGGTWAGQRDWGACSMHGKNPKLRRIRV